MTIKEFYCIECDQTASAETPHCPNCGAEDPWDERPAYRFDQGDLPFVFSFEVYKDSYELWRTFVNEYFGVYELDGSDLSGIPEQFPDMKYCVFTVYFCITEDYGLEGPFLDKEDAREAIA